MTYLNLACFVFVDYFVDLLICLVLISCCSGAHDAVTMPTRAGREMPRTTKLYYRYGKSALGSLKVTLEDTNIYEVVESILKEEGIWYETQQNCLFLCVSVLFESPLTSTK